MTLEQFIDELGKAPREGWRIDGYRRIRRLADTGPCGCPAQVVTGHSDDWLTAVDALALVGADTTRLLEAADGDESHDPTLRARLLAAVGLSEPRGEAR